MAKPQPLEFIKTITVSALEYPLYDNSVNPSRCYFGVGPIDIWDVEDSQKVFPAGLVAKTTFNIALTAKASVPLGKLSPPYSLSGKLGETEVFNANSPTITGGFNDLLITQPSFKGKPKSLPWTLSGDLIWIIRGSKADDPQYTCKTAVEIFVLPPFLPRFYTVPGISLSLLRLKEYLPAWMTTAEENDAIDWPTFVVNTMFNSPRLWYDNWDGSSFYTSWAIGYLERLFIGNDGILCWLDLWLEHMYDADSKRKYAANCYDLAALCQAVTSLGVDTSVNQINMNLMEPFGFIKPVRLIGRVESNNPGNLCNNPFYGQEGVDPLMFCDPNSSTRSKFDSHVFLTLDRNGILNVLDSCTGPKTGNLDLQAYITNTIDVDAYKNWPHLRPGTMADITEGIGIRRLVTSQGYYREITEPGSSSQNLLNNLALDSTKITKAGSWKQSYVASPQGLGYICATLIFVPEDKLDDIWTVNIFKYTDLEPLDDELGRRIRALNALGTAQKISAYEYLSDSGHGSIRLFGDRSRLFLATVETRLAASDDTNDFKNSIKAALTSTIFSSPVEYIKSLTLDPSRPQNNMYKVGEKVKVVLQTTQTGSKNWMGYNVAVDRGYVTFLESTHTEDNSSVSFTFLVRPLVNKTLANEAVEITMFGGSLDSETKLIKLWITA